MDAFNSLLYGFSVALDPMNIAYVFVGVFAGTIIGMLPGLGPISAVALMIPITFSMDPASGLILMSGVYYGAIFGGSTSSILLNAPGVAGTVATSFDGYPMARKGMAGKALAIAAYASFIGGTVSVIGLMLIAPLLSKVAVSFGPAEYFALMLLGLTAVVSLSDKSLVKGLIAAVVGMMISIVGIDLQTGTERYTFGSLELLDGIDFLVVALGVFALAEVFYMLLKGGGGKEQPRNNIGSLKLSRAEVKDIAGPIGRNSVLGFFIGVLPGAGATVASFLGYSFGIYFDKFVLQSNSKRKLFLPNGLHINLIGQIEHFNIQAIYIRIQEFEVFIYHSITHIFIKGIEPGLNSITPIKPFIQIIMKIIANVIS